MSKTDKTRPPWVQQHHGESPTRPYHRCHKDPSKCDLPAEPPLEHWSSAPDTTCYWGYGTYDGTNICGCKMCTMQAERKADNRKQRHSKERDIREQLN